MMDESDKSLKDMVELLLSKATMLQYHCARCKSPLFEKEGQIICPVCGTFNNEDKKNKDKKPEIKPEIRSEGKGREALEKKRDELIKRLEKEEDPEKIVSIAEAIKRLEDIIEK